MNEELNKIKKYYGEKFSHLCRELFPTILDEYPNRLLQILLDHFEPNKFLYDDLIKNVLIIDFSNYIYSFTNQSVVTKPSVAKTPKELLKEVGYNLYECQTEEAIQSFKKYYTEKEKLCTFNGKRLNTCYVFFAVKENIDDIKRENFTNPKRQDEYGTSVISIQFTKDKSHTLSIKNRYNHTVNNPDATFSNNLDNIVRGLTQSFETYYGLIQSNKSKDFEIPGYVLAKDGKYYKYNYEMNNIYYCPNNIIIDNYKVYRYDKSRYIVMDYFILDLKEKLVTLYDNDLDDSFTNTIPNIQKINILKNDNMKKLIMEQANSDNDNLIIELDSSNKIRKYINNNVQIIPSNFLKYNEYLDYIELSKVTDIYDEFLSDNVCLKEIKIPNIINIGHSFLCNNKTIENINFKVKNIGDHFMEDSRLIKVELPFVENIGDWFLYDVHTLQYIDISSVKNIGDACMVNKNHLKRISLPNVIKIGNSFMTENETLSYIDIRNAQYIGYRFLMCNNNIESLDLQNVIYLGDNSLYWNDSLKYLNIPNLKQLKSGILYFNKSLEKIYADKLEEYSNSCLPNNVNFSLYSIILENKKAGKQYKKTRLIPI